jgi:hypothetical protein
MADYPNLEQLARGCISGRFSEWPRLREEAGRALHELEELRERIERLEDNWTGDDA